MKLLLILLFLIANPIYGQSTEKLNILVISVCSLNKHHLPVYGYRRLTAPSLENFSKGSFVFKNAYTSLPWSNISRYLKMISSDFMKKNHYKTVRPYTPNRPFYLSTERESNDNAAKKELLTFISNKENFPFYAIAHFKINHFPYLEYLSPDDYPKTHPEYDLRNLNFTFLSQEDREYLKSRLNDSKFNLSDLPFFEIMSRNFKLPSKDNNQLWVFNQKLIDQWKTSPTYKKDLEVLINAYDGRIQILDRVISDYLNLFNNESLQKNTVVIFLGDHGQSLMEHDGLHSGSSTFDEQITLPLVIKFPGMNNKISINKQFSEESIKKIVEMIMKGKLNRHNFKSFVNKNFKNDEYIYSRNCSGNIKSVRLKNEWKLITFESSGTKSLFHLTNDPEERNNIITFAPKKILANLEEKLILHDYSNDLMMQYGPNFDGPCNKY